MAPLLRSAEGAIKLYGDGRCTRQSHIARRFRPPTWATIRVALRVQGATHARQRSEHHDTRLAPLSR
ncbi:hypothetical protein B0G82_6351 [Paraburkholderia sp. BL17N1]|nr:hypothetical protein B0G82_6351 [Paraburkholderia sp. BL17N1]